MTANFGSTAGLFFATMAWGASFFLVKKAVALVGLWPFLFYRLGLAAVLLALFVPKKLFKSSPKLMAKGLTLGFILFLTIWTQTQGLQWTTATKSGFITALYVPFTPLMAWVIFRHSLVARQMAVALLAFSGLYLLTAFGKQEVLKDFNKGDLWTLACSSLAAIHIVVTGRFSKEETDSLGLGLWQFLGCFAATAIAVLLQDDHGKFAWNIFQWPTFGIFSVVFNGAISTVFSFVMQIIAQRHMTSLKAALIFALEAPVSSGLSYIFLGETMTPVEFCGAGIVLLTSIIPQSWIAQVKGKD